jgi:hypothetical protein
LCKTNLEAAKPEALQSAPKSVRHLLLGLARTAQAFDDYLERVPKTRFSQIPFALLM